MICYLHLITNGVSFLVFLYIIAGIVVIILLIVLREKLSFYSKATCDVCGEQTGFKGNKRFKLCNGFMCQPCAEKTNINPGFITGGGPNMFSTRTVEEITETIRRREEVGDEQWVAELTQEMESKMAEVQARVSVTDNTPRCSKCGSTSISADKKGFGAGKAVVGAALAGPVGLAAGGIGAKKVRITCLNCGHHWTAGKE